ncbi:hypothetical protein UA08_06231 [Talaromyces atroroseus]|uniref:Uncharacterized protein n=1 Tax=Talaromyces atroroseus TaxID=1441469 RepID=A0A225AGQ2_TALAT|nr:hypothetical protein UA08_06231 [Talaromyces atroroseus]OKL58363.1 hypothetical protein UA08_06231 [Talaromyces atroroseus]
MSPARVLETIHKENELQTLTSALDALLVTAHQLSLREQDLQRRLRVAHDEYKRLVDRVESGFSDVEKTAVLEKIRPDDVSQPLPKLDPSLKPLDVVSHLRGSGHIQPQLADVVVAGIIYSRSIAERSSVGNSSVEVNPCVVAAKAHARRPSLYERDFTTTNGVTGSLRCPFAKPTGNGNGKSTTATYQDGQSSTTKCGFDPIKADLSQDRVSSAGASARSSTAAAARCPIRYMDDHSPEELAKYFENHKHEIPRSHAICVNRFQRNQTTMRQIDAKYGSLVSMIQGLGEKHKALLPEAERNGNGTSPSERVEKWAEDVSSKSPHPATLSTVEEDDAPGEADALDKTHEEEGDERMSHFERPLREIRVGESPSRPWGIPVPVTHQQLSAVNSPVAQVRIHSPELKTPKPTDSDIQQLQDNSPTPARPRGKCPFDHTAFMKKPPAAAIAAENSTPDKRIRADEAKPQVQSQTQAQAPSTNSNPNPNPNPSQMVFNGPVFFGYSAEETAALMQQLSNAK